MNGSLGSDGNNGSVATDGRLPVSGYDVAADGGPLVVNEEEAERVRAIFGLYQATGSVRLTLNEIVRHLFFVLNRAENKSDSN